MIMTDIPTRVTHINILTRDLEKSFEFYRDVMGFKYVMNLGPDKLVLDAGGFDFFLEKADEVHLNAKFHIGLKMDTECIEALAGKLADRGIPLVKGNNPGPVVYTTPDGKRTAMYFQDPDGWEIEAYSAV
jgi:catechol 2,3-dioxygenase-like lactoylglutathione lyase family enzyme